MKKRSLLTLLLASVLLVGCQGQSVPPATSDSSGSETSNSVPSESTSTGSDSTSSGTESTTTSDSTSEIPPEPVVTYSLSYMPGASDPEDLTVDIYQDGEPVVDLIEESWDFEAGVELAVDPWTANDEFAVTEVSLNGEPLSKDSKGQYPFVMPEQDSEITLSFGQTYGLSATCSFDSIARILFFEQSSFETNTSPITRAVAGTSIYAYLSFSDGYKAADFNVTTKNGETVLTPVAEYETQGELVYQFDMPASAVALTVELTTAPTNWSYYFLTEENLAFEAENDPRLSIAEINGNIPFLSPDVYAFSGVTKLTYTTSTIFTWVLTTSEKFATSYESGVYTKMEEIEAALGQVLLSSEGWSDEYSIFYKQMDAYTQIQLQVSVERNEDGTYSVGLRFGSYRNEPPTNWVATFNDINPAYEETESEAELLVTVEEIQANVPFISYSFDGANLSASVFDSTKPAWTLTASSQATTDIGLQAEVAAINEAAASVLTAEAGWTTGQLENGTTAYYKDIEGKTIWVYATLYGDSTYSPALVFDADIIHTSWLSYFSDTDLRYEGYYFFAVYAAEIDREFPFWESEYSEIVEGFDSAISMYDVVWAIGSDFASTQEQATALAAMEEELTVQMSIAGWTESSVTFDGESHTAYSHVSETNGETYYMYVRSATFTSTSGTTVYGVYYVFDRDVSSWENLYKDKASQEETTSFAMTLVEMKNYVPYWHSQYEDQFVTSVSASKFTEGYSAWSVSVSNLATVDEQSAAVTNLNNELATYLTNSSLGAEYNYTKVTIGEGESAFEAYHLVGDATYTEYYIYVEAYSETVDGSTIYGVKIVFDAEHNWGSLIYQDDVNVAESSTYCHFELTYAEIAANVPYVSGVNWSGFDYMKSSINSGDDVWYAYYSTSSTTVDADKAMILAELTSTFTDFTYDATNNQFTKVLASGETIVVLLSVSSDNSEIYLVFDVIQ